MRLLNQPLVLILFLMLPLFSPKAYAAPLAGTKKFDIKLTPEIGEVFDDSVRYTRDEREEWDLITELALGLGFRHEGKKHLFELLARDKQQIYARQTDLSNNSPDANLNYRYDITKRDHVGVRDSMSYSEQPRSFEEAFGQTTGRYQYFRNQADVDYTRDLTQRLSVVGRYGNDLNIFSGGGGLKDSYRNRAGFDLNFFKNTATLFSVLYEYIHTRFENSNSANIHAVAGRVRRDLTKQLYIEGKGGASFIDTFSDEFLARPLFSASLNGELDKKTQARILFQMGTDTNPFTEDIFQYYQTSLNIQRQLWKKLAGEASFFYGHGKYLSDQIRDNYWGANAELAYDLPQDFKIKLGYSFSKLLSSQSSREYGKNVVALRLVRTF